MVDDIDRLKAEISREVQRGMMRHDGVLDNAIEASQKRIRRRERVWKKRLLNSFEKYRRYRAGDDHTYQVVNFMRYAEAHDEGATFSAPPPIGPIKEWAEDHPYVMPDLTRNQAAYAISRSLYKDGLEGIHFTEAMRQYITHEAERDLERYLDRRVG